MNITKVEAGMQYLNHMECCISVKHQQVCNIHQLLPAQLPNHSKHTIHVHLQGHQKFSMARLNMYYGLTLSVNVHSTDHITANIDKALCLVLMWGVGKNTGSKCVRSDSVAS